MHSRKALFLPCTPERVAKAWQAVRSRIRLISCAPVLLSLAPRGSVLCAQVSTKITVVEALLEKADKVIIGGGMIFTFYKARGLKVGARSACAGWKARLCCLPALAIQQPG